MMPIIDAHLDLAWNALSFDRDLTLALGVLRQREISFDDHPSRGNCTVSLPELKRAGVALCVATLLARSGPDALSQPRIRRTDLDYSVPSIASAAARGQLAYYAWLEDQGLVRRVQTASDLLRHWEEWNRRPATAPIGLVLGMEGTDPIVQPEQVQDWWDKGLRVAGLAHYGRSQHAHGTGTDGPLTAAGLQLLREFDRLGMILDVTHLCDRSLDQALDSFSGTVIASHHNCRALVPGQRQLPDRLIQRLLDRQAVIGIALDAWMLDPNWVRGSSDPGRVSLEDAANHVDHICQLAGNAHHVAIGSDLDGGFGREQTPREVDTVRDLQLIPKVLEQRGYSTPDIEAVAHGNWLRVLARGLPGGRA